MPRAKQNETDSKEEVKEQRHDHYRGHFYRGSVLGLFLIATGTIFLLQNWGFISGDVWGKLWPILLIVAGIAILRRL